MKTGGGKAKLFFCRGSSMFTRRELCRTCNGEEKSFKNLIPSYSCFSFLKEQPADLSSVKPSGSSTSSSSMSSSLSRESRP